MLSIIIPVYNSEHILKTLIASLKRNIKLKDNLYEIILVNDFSLDNSWKIIEKLKKKNKFIKAINLGNNYGQHYAIFVGLKFAKGKYIVCMDDDMQHDPRYIAKIIKTLKSGHEVCYVRYLKQEHKISKIIISKLNNIVSSYLMSKSMKIYTSSFKGFSKTIKDKIIKNKSDFIFLDYWIFKYTKKITFINVKHKKRLSGETNYTFRGLLVLWSNMIFLIKTKNYDLKSLIILSLKFLFKTFFKKYVKYNPNKQIIINKKLL